MLIDRARVLRRPHRAWPPRRTMATVFATTALALLVACSGGSPPSTGSSSHTRQSSNSPSAVGYSACMRSHGVPNFPDPDSSGGLPKVDAQQLGVSDSQLQQAREACQRLLPTDSVVLNATSLAQCETTGDCPQTLVQQALTQLRIFAQCMRSRGAPKWPDPTIDSQGHIGFDISVSKLGFDPYSSQINSHISGCEHVMHPDIGVPMGVSR